MCIKVRIENADAFLIYSLYSAEEGNQSGIGRHLGKRNLMVLGGSLTKSIPSCRLNLNNLLVVGSQTGMPKAIIEPTL